MFVVKYLSFFIWLRKSPYLQGFLRSLFLSFIFPANTPLPDGAFNSFPYVLAH